MAGFSAASRILTATSYPCETRYFVAPEAALEPAFIAIEISLLHHYTRGPPQYCQLVSVVALRAHLVLKCTLSTHTNTQCQEQQNVLTRFSARLATPIYLDSKLASIT